MKIAGIISEYNPFHNGHFYHVEQTKKNLNVPYIVCVMSGNFTQRGQAAIADKWTRTQMALLGGVDAVFELPFLYATQSAEGFANGGIKVLNTLGEVDYLSFGSECASIVQLEQVADTLLLGTPSVDEEIRIQLKKGSSFATARSIALQKQLPELTDSMFSGSNNILGIEYIKALKMQKSTIIPYTIKRMGQSYTDLSIRSGYPSAAALRKALEQGKMQADELKSYIPGQSLSAFSANLQANQALFLPLMYKLRTMSPCDVRNICDVSEGLEYKLLEEASKAPQSIEELISAIKSKRYAYTRIARILLYCLFDVTKEKIQKVNNSPLPYLRLLGFRKQSEALISYLTQHATAPILSKASQFAAGASTLFEYDLRASDLYALLQQKIAPTGRDFKQKLIVI